MQHVYSDSFLFRKCCSKISFFLLFSFHCFQFFHLAVGTLFFYLLRTGAGAGAKRPSLPKICYKNSTKMKLGTVYLTYRRPKKYINHVKHPLSSADISIFSSEINKFCYMRKYRYRLHFST